MTPESIQRFARQRVALQNRCYGQWITYEGVAQKLVLSDVSSQRELEEAGFRLQHDATLRVPVVAGKSAPQLGAKITRQRDGRQYRINEVIDDPIEAEWVAGLEGL